MPSSSSMSYNTNGYGSVPPATNNHQYPPRGRGRGHGPNNPRPSYQPPTLGATPTYATTDLTDKNAIGDGYYTTSQNQTPVTYPNPQQQSYPPQQHPQGFAPQQPQNILMQSEMPEMVPKGLKRKFQGTGGRQFPKVRKINLNEPQNPISLLGMLKQGIVYNIDAIVEGQPQSGFKCSVKVDGKEFIVEALSKKVAKGACAEAVLQHFLGQPESMIYQQLSSRMREMNPNADCSTGRMLKTFYSIQEKEKERLEEKEKICTTIGDKETMVGRGGSTTDSEGNMRNPVSILNEKCRGNYTFELSWEKVPSGMVMHTAKLTINGNVYTQKGTEKKSVKSKAALEALAAEFSLTEEALKEPQLLSSNKKKKTSSGSPNKAQPSTEALQALAQTSPLMVLNQLCQGSMPNIVITEKMVDAHNKVFEASCSMSEDTFSTIGHNKKKSKNDLAKQILNKIYNIQFTVEPTPAPTLHAPKPPVDKLKNIDDKTAVQLLNEILGPGEIDYKDTEDVGEAHKKIFKVTLTIQGEQFEGTGYSKKIAKSDAAKKVLLEKFGVTVRDKIGKNVLPPIPDELKVPQKLADDIGKLVNDKFLELVAGNARFSRRKVLAGIVLSGLEEGNPNHLELICVTTGTKCVNGEHISIEGISLNDSHAEVVARRCFMEYIYRQLDDVATKPNKENSILELNEGKTKWRVKPNIKIHLFISTSPCGDARIFSPHEVQEDDPMDSHPYRKSRGLLRTKIESGEGTIPVKQNEATQTWDGVVAGQRLLTMSCSDKVARWNVLGLQGSLLSNYMEPVYLSDIILGSLFHHTHLYRAVCGRIESAFASNNSTVSAPFKINRMCMSLLSTPEPRFPGKAPNYSINWINGYEGIEVVNAITGKTEDGETPRLCKRQLFTKFYSLCPKLTPVTGLHVNKVQKQYGEAKKLHKSYQATKESMYVAFIASEMGTWIEKPVEQDMFILNT